MTKLSLLLNEVKIKKLVQNKYKDDEELHNLVENLINYREQLEQEISIYLRMITRLKNILKSFGLDCCINHLE